MSDGAWLDADEIGFEHHPDLAEAMHARGCDRARVLRAAQRLGARWVLLDVRGPDAAFRAIVTGTDAVLEDHPDWDETWRTFHSD